jgi:hypothetical protein
VFAPLDSRLASCANSLHEVNFVRGEVSTKVSLVIVYQNPNLIIRSSRFRHYSYQAEPFLRVGMCGARVIHHNLRILAYTNQRGEKSDATILHFWK